MAGSHNSHPGTNSSPESSKPPDLGLKRVFTSDWDGQLGSQVASQLKGMGGSGVVTAFPNLHGASALYFMRGIGSFLMVVMLFYNGFFCFQEIWPRERGGVGWILSL